MDTPCLRAEAHKALRLAAAREGANAVAGPVQIGEQIEPLGGTPGVPCQERSRRQLDVAVQALARIGKQLIEYVPHGEYGRPGIDRCAANRDLTNLAARMVSSLDRVTSIPAAARSIALARPATPAPMTAMRGVFKDIDPGKFGVYITLHHVVTSKIDNSHGWRRFVDAMTQIERSLLRSLELAKGFEAPPLLLAALRYAVFPGGARIRPRLCLAVARACSPQVPPLALAAAAAIELLHCASLVHDDLPCFDDAATRRGRPSVHRAFDERIAVLDGRCADRARLSVGCNGRCRRLRAGCETDGSHRAGRRRPGRHHCRSSVGMRAANRPRELPESRRRAPCSRRRRRPGRARQVTRSRLGTRSASAWARRTRSPTISAMSSRSRETGQAHRA